MNMNTCLVLCNQSNRIRIPSRIMDVLELENSQSNQWLTLQSIKHWRNKVCKNLLPKQLTNVVNKHAYYSSNKTILKIILCEPVFCQTSFSVWICMPFCFYQGTKKWYETSKFRCLVYCEKNYINLNVVSKK